MPLSCIRRIVCYEICIQQAHITRTYEVLSFAVAARDARLLACVERVLNALLLIRAGSNSTRKYAYTRQRNRRTSPGVESLRACHGSSQRHSDTRARDTDVALVNRKDSLSGDVWVATSCERRSGREVRLSFTCGADDDRFARRPARGSTA